MVNNDEMDKDIFIAKTENGDYLTLEEFLKLNLDIPDIITIFEP